MNAPIVIQPPFRRPISVFNDYFSAAQQADVIAGTALLDVSTAIQAALDVGGTVRLDTPGTYRLNTALEIGDDTWLKLGPNVTPQRGADFISMVVSKAARLTPTAVTLSALNTGTVTCTIASPAVLTWTGNPLVNGNVIVLSTTGALPTGLSANTNYFVINKSGNTFNLATTPFGTAINTSGVQSGTHTATQNDNLVKVTWAGHPFTSIGLPVSIEETTQSYYNGVFLVDSIVDANTFTYHTERAPLVAPSGSTVARRANKNIRITGGNWDYNYPNYNVSNTPGTHSTFWMGYVYRPHIESAVNLNGGIYMVDSGALRSHLFDNLTNTSTIGDTVKIYGPAFGGITRLSGGVTADDCVSMQCKEFDAFATYRWTHGDILDPTIEQDNGVAGYKSGNTVALYLSANELMDNVTIRGLGGNALGSNASSVYITGSNLTDTAGRIAIEKVRGQSISPKIRLGACTIEKLTVDGITISPRGIQTTVTESTSLIGSSSTRIKTLEFLGMNVPAEATWTGTHYIVQNNGQIDQIIFRSPQALPANNFVLVLNAAGSTNKVIDIYDPNLNSTNLLVWTQSGVSGAPKVNYYGGRVIGADALAYFRSDGSVTIDNTKIDNVANGVVSNDDNVTIDVYARGVVLTAGNWNKIWSGAPSYRWHTFDAVVDPTLATNVMAAGGFEYSGSAFHGGPNAGNRGVFVTEHFISLSGDQTGADTINAQPWFPGGGATGFVLPALTSYFFEGELTLFKTAGTSSRTIALLFGGTATLTSIEYQALALAQDAASFTAAAPVMLWGNVATALTVWPTASISANQVFTVKIRGIVRINGAGTLIPQYKYSAAPGGAPTSKGNSWFRLHPIGSNTVLKVGNAS